MTGAGSAIVAYTVEDEFGAGPAADPTWIQPGINISISELTVEQALRRSRHPNSPLPAGSRPGDFEGAAAVSWSLTDANFHDLVFADGGTALPTDPMPAPSSAWLFGTKLPDGTLEPRTPTGTIVTNGSITYERGSDIRAELTMIYGFEPDDITTPAEGDIQQPDESEVYSYHGADFSVDGMGQPLMQSTTISLDGLARFRRGQGRHPYDAVTGPIEPALSTDSTFTERDQLQLAVDDVDDTSPEEIGKVPGSMTLKNGQGSTIEYGMEGLQPTNYSWNALVDGETDLSEPINWHVTNVSPTVTP